ncbi:hypothetical protein M758_5G188400 [Ceratodon purpureus]|nr:hypothetical protein M758_5G188400 [Ceratodon purpureus]
MPEWLSGMTRNHVGFARAGSNPAEHVRRECSDHDEAQGQHQTPAPLRPQHQLLDHEPEDQLAKPHYQRAW